VREEAPLEVEVSAETVGEAKWLALRELERRVPRLDRMQVVFEVVSEGERGLLGVGRRPASVRARVLPSPSSHEQGAGSQLACTVRELVERVVEALGASCSIDVREDAGSLRVLLEGPGVSLIIGRRGQTLDALQRVVAAVAQRLQEEPRRTVTVDAASYCARREARMAALAERTAKEVERTGRAVVLPPMTAAERRIVHLSLRGRPGVETRSEGADPGRYVVVAPRGG
jgi:spoIIIJ-associated protein